MIWLAALKPTTIGVPDFRDDVREYLEIAVLRRHACGLMRRRRGWWNWCTGRCLIRLSAARGPRTWPSACRSPTSDGRRARRARWWWRTIVHGSVSARMREREPRLRFLASLALGKAAPHATLYVLYQGWIDRLADACRRPTMTGAFAAADSADQCNGTARCPGTPRPTPARHWPDCVPQATKKSTQSPGGAQPRNQTAGSRAGRDSKDTMKDKTMQSSPLRPRNQVARPRRGEHRAAAGALPRTRHRGEGRLRRAQACSWATDHREEKYGLNWHGKRRARQLALTPSTGTLRPARKKAWTGTPPRT